MWIQLKCSKTTRPPNICFSTSRTSLKGDAAFYNFIIIVGKYFHETGFISTMSAIFNTAVQMFNSYPQR